MSYVCEENCDETLVKLCCGGGSEAGLTVNSRASLNRPLRLLWRKALELPVLDIRILAKRAFCEEKEAGEATC